jgi:hypothetical protein
MCAGHKVRGDDPELMKWLTAQNRTWDDVVNELIGSRLVARGADGSLELITNQCQCVIIPTGQYLAADNNTGRLDRWLSRRVDSWMHDR